ncbi:MAG: ornithine cyclodeaminase family protein [Pseudomonadota bacterium]|nr:ornithine cyclodeaminase family protein [Burkholderiaceae bacterium]MDQ3445825.1 ornithine cyclodeaminase family protein [Pseudomonadota bacterium]
MRFFSAEEVHSALSLPALADAIAQAFRAGTTAPLRHAHALSATDSLLLMPAWNAAQGGAIGVKLVTVLPNNRARDFSTVNALYVLFDRESGEPRAVIDGEALTLRRTAAASLLAARYLARRDARNVLIVGTGRLARFMARAHCAGRDVERLLIWGRSAEHAQALASTLRTEGLPAEAAADLEHVVGTSHVISCATTATSPIVHGAWLQPGTHLDLVGAFRRDMREVDDAAVARSQVYVDTYAGALAEAADVIEPIERGVIAREDVRGELADLVTGSVPGRKKADDITLFKSVGTAIEDLAAASLLVTLAG